MEKQLSEETVGPDADEIHEMMVQKAHELFTVCDKEEKGFITKRDMQRLRSELPLSPDQLESVFDSLDDDGNGFLTLTEFTDGFGSFLGMKPQTDPDDADEGETLENVYEGEEGDVEDKKLFEEMMDDTGASRIFQGDDTIKALWVKLRRDEPELIGDFENFLTRVTTDIKRSQGDFDILEAALKSKSSAHDEEITKLYEEMECQIKQEKERILAEEKAKERQLREEMEKEMREKDSQLQELMQKHQEMEDRLKVLNMTEAETKQENERLMKEKESLEEMLLNSQENLEESKTYINQLQQQQKDDTRERARAALKMTEGIAMERESLVKQLDMLKDMNRKLRDDKDEAEAAETRRDQSPTSVDRKKLVKMPSEIESREEHSSRRKELTKQGSVLSNYFPTDARRRNNSRVSETLSEDVDGNMADFEDDDVECDDVYVNNSSLIDLHGKHCVNGHIKYSEGQQNSHGYEIDVKSSQKLKHAHTQDDNYSDAESEAVTRGKNALSSDAAMLNNLNRPDAKFSSVAMAASAVTTFAGPKPSNYMKRHSPASKDHLIMDTLESSDGSWSQIEEPSGPERIFKVVFVGDSGVGKSSFIYRFCNNLFKANFSATIGVDFQIKSMLSEGHLIALQLWDTAGQERFRSITKQYFRKADGVLIVYDVTSENSFINIRNWMTSVKDGVDEGTVLVIVGNKTDLAESDERAVKTKDGSHLADEYGALFFETSAKSGTGVKETMEALASLLREKEDKAMEDALKLDLVGGKKKGCCGR